MESVSVEELLHALYRCCVLVAGADAGAVFIWGVIQLACGRLRDKCPTLMIVIVKQLRSLGEGSGESKSSP